MLRGSERDGRLFAALGLSRLPESVCRGANQEDGGDDHDGLRILPDPTGQTISGRLDLVEPFGGRLGLL